MNDLNLGADPPVQGVSPTNILLAPMEGVVDAQMRGVFTSIGGFTRCVTEFVRVTEQKIPNHVFHRFAPELHQGGVTDSGVPVYVQLLGGNAHWMALNAARLARLKPQGIDLNFGCPSKTVNRSDGGSVLLKEPERVGNIVSAVRDAVDPAIPVTAKIRLGFDDTDDLEEITARIIAAGATELCVHARTKADRYKPPAHWHEVMRIAAVANAAQMPLTINGDIWSTEAAELALRNSGAQHVMLGRGALRKPDLAQEIQAGLSRQQYTPMTWSQVLAMLIAYLTRSTNQHPLFVGNRAKQWLGFLKVTYPQAELAFQAIKTLKEADQVVAELNDLQQALD